MIKGLGHLQISYNERENKYQVMPQGEPLILLYEHEEASVATQWAIDYLAESTEFVNTESSNKEVEE